MKIAYVTVSIPFGKNEAFVIPEVKALIERGHDVRMFPLRPAKHVVHADAEPLLEITERKPLLTPVGVARAYSLGVTNLLRTDSTLAKRVASESANPTQLAKNLAAFPKAVWMASRFRQLGIEHVHSHWASTTSTAAMIAAALAGIPWSCTAHRWDIAENNLLALKAERASYIRAIDSPGAAEIAEVLGYKPKNLGVIHMGVPLPEDGDGHPGPVPPSDVHTCKFVMVANFVEKKGHRYAVEAMREMAEAGVPATLEFVGDGPMRPEIEKAAASLDSVSFAGLMPHSQIIERMRSRRWDAFILPSIVTSDGQREGIPVSLMEAMSCSLPVVSTPTGGIPELVGNGAGLLVAPEDSHALADAMTQLARNPSLRSQLSSVGLERVRQEFDVEAVAARLEDIFTESVSDLKA